MSKDARSTEAKTVKPKQAPVEQQEPAQQQAAGPQSIDGILSTGDEPSVAVAAHLKDPRVPTAQRQAYVSHVGQRFGNLFVQRVIDHLGPESDVLTPIGNDAIASRPADMQRQADGISRQGSPEIQRWDWGRAAAGGLAGAAGGALIGAGIGSMFGGAGAVPGALIGGAIGAVGGAVVGGLSGGGDQERPEQQGEVAHTSGEQVDAYLDASPFIRDYIEEKAESGIRAQGHVHIHTPSEFVDEWVAYAMTRTNSATGNRYTEEEARAAEPNINAFRDGTEIHIHQDRGEAGTAIHESMHLYSDDGYRNRVGSNANEGTTEFFTRMVCEEQEITRGAFYTRQRRSVETLVEATSDELLAGAYFQGNIDALESSVDSAAGENGFTNWITFMKAGRYSDADALF